MRHQPKYMKLKFFISLLLFSFNLQGQDTFKQKGKYYRFAISNSHTAKPLGSFFSLVHKEFHPGFEISRGKTLKQINKHQWLAELTLGYLYHRWVQQNLAVSANAGYHRLFGESCGATVKLGGGYQLSMPAGKVYAITDNGLKEKGHVLRSQAIAAISIGADKTINDGGVKLFIDYQQKIQIAFIKEYVPLLPYNTLLVGVRFPIHSSNSNDYEK
jgi:hypothetical protein